jgi:hypothetical protein
MNEVTSNQTLIGTLRKSFDLATINGNLKLKRLYLLNLINKFMYCCGSNITFNQKQHLQNLSIAIQNLDKNICIYREQRSIYTNIVGCKNCKNLNNSPYIVINTPPEIDDPIEVVPVIKPIVCDIIFQLNRGIDVTAFELETFVKCFNYLGNVNSYSTLKIITIPELGILQEADGTIINENSEVNLNEGFEYLKYTFIGTERPTTDTFTFQISTDETDPEVFSETYTATINILE